MANIIDDLMGYITPDFLRNTSGQLEEEEKTISNTLSGLIPGILGGMVNTAENDRSLFDRIFALINDDSDESALDDPGSLINSGNLARNDPRDRGGNLLSMLFGNRTGSVLDGVGSYSGAKRSTVSSLMSVAAPLILSYLGRRTRRDGLNAAGLASFLLGQKSSITSSLPAVLGSVFGLGATRPDPTPLNTPTTTTTTTTAPPPTTAETGSGIWRWLLPLLAGVALLFFVMRGCDDDPDVAVVDPVVTDTVVSNDPMGDRDNDQYDGAMVERSLPGGVVISGRGEGIENQLVSFIEADDRPVDKDTWFNFDALNFRTGSAELDMAYSERQLNNIYEVMKAYPDVEIKIGGYTDSDGDDNMNMKLSQERAETVMNALINKGIDDDRLEAEGYGENHPACPANDTPACKAQNRRIAVRVTDK